MPSISRMRRFRGMMPIMASTAHESESKYLLDFIDSIPALIHTARPDGYLDYFNQFWLEYVGVPQEDLVGWKWTAAIHPEDVEGIVNKWRLSLASGEQFLYEARVRRADGNYRWMLHRKVAVRDDGGDIVKWYGSSIDIEERKQTEFYLAEGQRLAHTGSWAFNAAGFDYWSSELFQIFGFDAKGKPPTVEEYLGLMHPEDREFVQQKIQKILADHRGFDFTKRILRSDGKVRHVRWVGVPVADCQNFQGFVGTGIDVTEQEQLTDNLRKSEIELRQILDLTPQLVGVYGPNPERLYANRMALDYLGMSLDEWRRRPLGADVHPDDVEKLKACWDRALATGSGYEVELRLHKHDGSYRWFLARYNPVRDDNGQVTRWYVACTDIEDRKRAEERLQQENADLKRAEEKIREQEAELRQMLDLTPQHVHVLTADASLVYSNEIALKYHGSVLHDWQLRPLIDWRIDELPITLFHPDDRERVMCELKSTLSSGSPHETEARLLRNDDKYLWFLFRYNPLRDEQGRVVRWFVAGTDIEDRKRAEEKLQQENVALREEVDQTSMFEEIVGTSPALHAVLSSISKVAPSDSTVLVMGETGTGKELVARAIHRRSNRASGPFISVNCAAIPRDLIHSELFGHEKGAFTGATQQRLGRFELADGGTIFLDEVGELLPDIQVALLRVLQEREFERVGGGQPTRVDVRVIAATNRDLHAAEANGTFRQDLFYRLNVFPIEVPPLRRRKDDILMLVEYFVQRYANKASKNIRSIDKKTIELLQAYDWPGNIRELQNVIERSVILSSGEVFSVDELWLSQEKSRPASRMELSKSETEPRSEREIIEAALAESRGRVSGSSGAAAKLGIPPSTLDHRIKALKINKKRFKFR
jgi:formate hydrogenlyase transcriptional activator